MDNEVLPSINVPTASMVSSCTPPDPDDSMRRREAIMLSAMPTQKDDND